MDITDVTEALESPVPPNVQKILDAAEDNGWSQNPYISLVLRLAKPEDPMAKPFFMKWELAGRTPKGKLSWRFAGARASNGQPLTIEDALVYLEDPSVIYPDPPAETETPNA